MPLASSPNHAEPYRTRPRLTSPDLALPNREYLLQTRQGRRATTEQLFGGLILSFNTCNLDRSRSLEVVKFAQFLWSQLCCRCQCIRRRFLAQLTTSALSPAMSYIDMLGRCDAAIANFDYGQQ